MIRIVHSIGVAIIMTTGFCACKEMKKKLLPSFSVNIPDINLTIPPIAFVSEKEVPVGALRTPINMDSTIKAHTAGTFGAGSVSSVKVKGLVIKLLNENKNNNLSNFESAKMTIYSGNDTSSADIAVIKFPETSSDSLAITPTATPEISSYLKGSQLGYNLFWKNRKPTNKFLKLVVKVTLSVQ